MKLVEQLQNRLMYPAAYTYIAWQSKLSQIKSWGKKDQVRFAQPYAGQRVMLMALYEKGCIRDDVVAAMSAARALGVYVIGVNTLKLSSPDDYRDVMDCYIERYNFGRDFGSYKSGFNYLYSQGIAEECPRLLMINDSLFFSKKHMSSFLQDMFSLNAEVLGSTENFEIEHHLGSFCIAISNSVLNHKKLKDYWRSYRCSDIRPVVIKTGEMKLSKVLRSVVSNVGGFRSLYDTAHVAKVLKSNPLVLDGVAYLSRNSDLVDWPRFSFAKIVKSFGANYLHSSASIAGVSVTLEGSELSVVNTQYARSVSEFEDYICNSISNSDVVGKNLSLSIRDEVIAHFIDCFSRGSQIHQNNAFLHSIGLPLIKLDGIYRGMFNSRDIERIADDLDTDQQEEFRRIMYSRPFGGVVLVGWKRAAFMRGLM